MLYKNIYLEVVIGIFMPRVGDWYFYAIYIFCDVVLTSARSCTTTTDTLSQNIRSHLKVSQCARSRLSKNNISKIFLRQLVHY